MRAAPAAVAALLACALAPALAAGSPELDYMLECRGCHLEDGRGAPGAVPSLERVGRFLAASRGREYLVRVPGSAQSRLSDADLAALLDWIVLRFDPEAAAAGFERFDPVQVGRWRSVPLIDVETLRAALLDELSRSAASARSAR